MIHSQKIQRLLGRPSLFLVAVCLFFFSTRGFSQGCASCYTTAAAGGSQTIHALRSGILVLLFPPVLIFGGIVTLVWRWRSKFSSNTTEKA